MGHWASTKWLKPILIKFLKKKNTKHFWKCLEIIFKIQILCSLNLITRWQATHYRHSHWYVTDNGYTTHEVIYTGYRTQIRCLSFIVMRSRSNLFFSFFWVRNMTIVVEILNGNNIFCTKMDVLLSILHWWFRLKKKGFFTDLSKLRHRKWNKINIEIYNFLETKNGIENLHMLRSYVSKCKNYFNLVHYFCVSNEHFYHLIHGIFLTLLVFHYFLVSKQLPVFSSFYTR